MTVIDQRGRPVPSQQFLSMIIILLRKCQGETGMSLVDFLMSFDAKTYHDDAIRPAVHKRLLELYPDEPKK